MKNWKFWLSAFAGIAVYKAFIAEPLAQENLEYTLCHTAQITVEQELACRKTTREALRQQRDKTAEKQACQRKRASNAEREAEYQRKYGNLNLPKADINPELLKAQKPNC